ncbi:fatty acid/sphingolipid desaturase [Epithele typhae]|uniref:fatty acid/sphingolipid desaturase n=1 Tax=Epithele typhae TaxID=378194 RepID=UPI002007FCA4|nr:fatty acid/sphingolipid desaturase [Epithele typhae]KAH9944294.1 fatty acid/sphingolipid desaturase [Epithele typhae]
MGLPEEAKVWTREQVAARVLAGDNLFILNGSLIRVPASWLTAHPGGRLSILHYTGRDATDEVEAFHSDESLKKMRGFSIGRVELGEQGWLPLVPPIANGWVRRVGKDGRAEWYNEATPVQPLKGANAAEILLVSKDKGVSAHTGPTLADLEPSPNHLSLKNEKMNQDVYKEMHKRVIDAGLYNTPYFTGYGPEFVRYTLLAAISAFSYSKGWFMSSALFLGLFWQQLTFFAHDLGHVGVTHDWLMDRLISIFIADLVGGLSIGWWVHNHNVHHLVTNHPSHDPDIQHLPFLAISPKFLNSLWSSYHKREMTLDGPGKFFVSVQHKLFYVVLGLARFNLYANSYVYLAKTAFEPRRYRGGRWWWWAEVVCLGLFFTWFAALLRGCGTWPRALAFLLVSHVAAAPVHVQIVLSHFSRSTDDLGPVESFFARQLRTTVDVICSPLIEFIHGGLHLQVTHHLFPRLPRHNLRAASLIVKEYAKERGLEYAEFGFVEGNGEVRGVLKQVADQIKIIGMVADSEVEWMCIELASPASYNRMPRPYLRNTK